jgi:hypothetical protein
MSKSRRVRLESVDGEKHFIVQDCSFEPLSNGKDYNEVEAKKAARKEATKPLLLTRL